MDTKFLQSNVSKFIAEQKKKQQFGKPYFKNTDNK